MSTPRVRRLDSNRDMMFGRGAANYASTSESTIERIRSRLLLLKFEWFLDTSAGVPWFNPGPDGAQVIMGGPRNLQFAEAEIKKCILGTEGVASLTLFTMSLNNNTRKLTVTAKGTTVDGDAFSFAGFTIP